MRIHITIARAGTLVFTALLTVTMLTAERTPADAATSQAVAARPAVAITTITTSAATDRLAVPTLSAPDVTPLAVLGEETAPETVTEPGPVAAPAPPPVASGGSFVLASWYGPGFYGNRTACGQIYSSQIMGVAHKTLPCGTLLVLSYGGRTVTVPVIDRGPYAAGRTLDLSAATKGTLGCPDLCTLLMQFVR